MERKAKELPKLPESECDAAACPATRRMPVSLGIMQGIHDARTSSITGLTQCSNNLIHMEGSCPFQACVHCMPSSLTALDPLLSALSRLRAICPLSQCLTCPSQRSKALMRQYRVSPMPLSG